MKAQQDLLSRKFHVTVCSTYRELCDQVVREILRICSQRTTKDYIGILLSGGSTPKGIYSLMAENFYGGRFQWEKIHFFFGDERYVPPSDLRSNYRMVSESLFCRVGIPASNIHAFQTEKCDFESCALNYEEEIRAFYQVERGKMPRFDLVLLGLGEDGHVASLFPAHPVLKETERLVVHVDKPELEEKRVSVTLSLINHAENIFFIVNSHRKAKILECVWKARGPLDALPASLVRPVNGHVRWFVDQNAVSG